MRHLAALLAILAPPANPEEKGKVEGPETFSMSPAVICETVTGYEDYVPRPAPEVRLGEKLRIYYRVEGHTVDEKEGRFRIHLVQDAIVRRKGSKRAYMTKKNFTEFRYDDPEPPGEPYFENTLELRNAPPGEYELEVILWDKLSPDTKSRQLVPFRVKESAKIDEDPPALRGR